MKKTIKRIMLRFFPEPPGTPIDTTPGLKISHVVEPPQRANFNEVFTNAHASLNKMKLN